MKSRVFCMPTYNEGWNTVIFVRELSLHPSFREHDSIIVVDDCSSDLTGQLLSERAQAEQLPVKVHFNQKNIGHGPTTAGLWEKAIESDAEIIVMTDGDGEISLDGLFVLAEAAESEERCVIGKRIRRDEPAFRKVLTFVTRALILLFSGRLAKDANSPYRAFPRAVLVDSTQALREISSLRMANLYQTLWLILKRAPIYIDIEMEGRRDGKAEGVTWKSRTNFLPSRRLILFAWASFIESVTTLPKVRRIARSR